MVDNERVIVWYYNYFYYKYRNPKLVVTIIHIINTLLFIYKYLHSELESVIIKADKDKNELLQRTQDFEEIALKRLEKIQALEAQLRQFVYGLNKKQSGRYWLGVEIVCVYRYNILWCIYMFVCMYACSIFYICDYIYQNDILEMLILSRTFIYSNNSQRQNSQYGCILVAALCRWW